MDYKKEKEFTSLLCDVDNLKNDMDEVKNEELYAIKARLDVLELKLAHANEEKRVWDSQAEHIKVRSDYLKAQGHITPSEINELSKTLSNLVTNMYSDSAMKADTQRVIIGGQPFSLCLRRGEI